MLKTLIFLALLFPQPGTQPTPSFVIDSGAGVGPTAWLMSGSTDEKGWIAVTTGSDTPIDRRGIVTVVFGAPLPKPTVVCIIPGNEAARQLAATVLIPASRAHFIIYSPEYNPNRAQLQPYTTYIWRYEVGESCIKDMQN